MDESTFRREIDAAAAAAGCAAPWVRVKKMRNACYNPLVHRISVSAQLLDSLPDPALRTLAAHEVAHSTQREEMLRDAAHTLLLPVLAWLVAAIGTIGTFLSGYPSAALWLLAGATLVTIPLSKWADRQWEKTVLEREYRADAFAEAYVQVRGATARMLQACADIENDGHLGEDAMRRIQRLRTGNPHGAGFNTEPLSVR